MDLTTFATTIEQRGWATTPPVFADADVDNGPVRVIDGSHRHGRISGTEIDELRRTSPERDCLAERGAILAFRPLILHASAPAATPAHRRVIHIEYAVHDLPTPLEWYDRVAEQSGIRMDTSRTKT